MPYSCGVIFYRPVASSWRPGFLAVISFDASDTIGLHVRVHVVLTTVVIRLTVGWGLPHLGYASSTLRLCPCLVVTTDLALMIVIDKVLGTVAVMESFTLLLFSISLYLLPQ